MKLFAEGQPNGNRVQNCASLWFDPEGFFDYQCDNDYHRHCACSFTEKPTLNLKGLSSKSNFDVFYTLFQGMKLSFYGLQQTKIDYDPTLGNWQVKGIALPTKGLKERLKL